MSLKRDIYGGIPSIYGPYETVLSDAELRTVLYPYDKRAVFGRFPLLYGSNTVSRIITYCHSKRSQIHRILSVYSRLFRVVRTSQKPPVDRDQPQSTSG